MRLINVETLDLEEFYGEQIPKYAILSHTWEHGEVTLQDWSDRGIASKKPGFAKIMGACRQTLNGSLKYLWVDTNCIDKTSSADLTEAINSMFAWYRDAEICYAYMVDVRAVNGTDPDLAKRFRKSRWFTRGWTLQELLAPREVDFFSQGWARIGSRSSLGTEISAAAGIDSDYFTGTPVMEASISEKMSWLSRRVTTRIEDMAYCVLGIFDINMPLLYGEGTKAFIRLQEEIIKVSNDHTIFCWTWTDSTPDNWVSMLAPSPVAFQFSSSYTQRRMAETPSTYSMTNAGLSIHLKTLKTLSYSFAILDIVYKNQPLDQRAVVPIGPHHSGAFRRLPFPPKPSLCGSSVTTFDQDLFISARATPYAGRSFGALPPAKYGIILTFGDVRPLLDNLNDYSHLESENCFISVENVSGLLGIKTHPANCFDSQRSLIFLPPNHEENLEKCSGVFVRLGSSKRSGFVLFFGIRVLASGEVLWFCGVHPPYNWNEIRLNRQSLSRRLRAELATRTESTLISQIPHSTKYLCIHSDVDTGHGLVTRLAHIVTDSWVARLCRAEDAAASDNDSNCAVAP